MKFDRQVEIQYNERQDIPKYLLAILSLDGYKTATFPSWECYQHSLLLWKKFQKLILFQQTEWEQVEKKVENCFA